MKRIFIFILVLFWLVCTGCAAEEDKPQESPPPPFVSYLPLPGEEKPAASTEPDPVPTSTPTPMLLAEPSDYFLVNLKEYIPNASVQLRYATGDNFTGKIIYDFNEAYLRYGTVKKLAAVQEELETMGLGLKVWDAFRPVSAQYVLWETCPNPVYVANPNTGFSSHSRGNTLDITLVNAKGDELIMPTVFDDFSSLADRNYSDCPPEAAENALLLQNVMEKHGFSGYFGEWWHFSDSQSYEVERVFDPAVIAIRRPKCEEFISLRSDADISASVLTTIPVGGSFTLLGYTDEFSYVEYLGIRGYVLTSYTME